MNILIFISSLIIILGISSNTLINNSSSSERSDISYSSYFKVSTDINNQLEEKLFDKAPVVTKKKDSPLIKTIKNVTKKFSLPDENELCCLNIFNLISDGKDQYPLLYNIFSNLIFILYDNTSLFSDILEKKFVYQLIDEIVFAAQKELDSQKNLPIKQIYLEKLTLKSKSLQTVYYQMLKGTNHYNFQKKQGYPSLLNYVICSSNIKDTINIPYSPEELLCAIFNYPIANEVFYTQRKDKEFYPITKPQLEEIIVKHNYSYHEFNPWPLLEFKNKKHRKNKIVKSEDEKTNIKIIKKVNY